MRPPHNDDAPKLHTDVEFDVAEILEEYNPTAPSDLERLADEAERGAETYQGGPVVAAAVAAELRRRAKAWRDSEAG
ncbi:hypothetical protein [Caulobacter sp. 1776]|uniref:hypothetical protein n=1 Tax=Caulobacter sp. 1776 TaxID=3156420 RepID=UPI00339AE4DA